MLFDSLAAIATGCEAEGRVLTVGGYLDRGERIEAIVSPAIDEEKILGQ